ncbi:hypothetical protein ACIA8G_21800 [Lentzea sp. NPDC051213]|uniref:hypothetical protein n=1 Tax=Lentzea sp. NPDC051213 TaxID=3364126 RepID=UPI003792CCAD
MDGHTTASRYILCRSSADIDPVSTLEAAAIGLSEDIAELRADGGLPSEVHFVVNIVCQQQILEVVVTGLSVDDDPDREAIRSVVDALFELGSMHNIVYLDCETPPLFTQRIVLVDHEGRPFAAKIGAASGDVDLLYKVP